MFLTRVLTDHTSRYYYPIRWLVIILLGLAVYAQTFGCDFVFDDHLFIVTNSYIKDLTSVTTIWNSFPATRMIGMFSFSLNYFFGQLHPQGYHIVNLCIHWIAVGMVWATASKCFEIAKAISTRNKKDFLSEELSRDLPYLIALLFLVHPCHTQAVTYITQRFESIATVFYLGAVYCYLRARTESASMRQVTFFLLSALSTLLGMMTKEVAVTIPVMILVAEWILVGPYKRCAMNSQNQKGVQINGNRVWLYIILAGITIALGFLFMFLVHGDWSVFSLSIPSASHDGDVFTLRTYVLTQTRVFLTFLRLLFVPAGQNLDFDFPMSAGILNPPSTLAGAVIISLMLFTIVRFKQQVPVIAFGLAWMLVTFSINFVPRQNAIFEHKIYLISFGFFIAAAAFLPFVLKQRIRVVCFLACCVAVLAVAAFNRNQVWRSELTLWEDVYKKSPNKARVNANLGRVYGNLKRHDDAIRLLSKAIAIKPDDPISLLNRGILYHDLGRDQEALDDLGKAIAIDAQYFSVFTARAKIFIDKGNDPAALQDLEQAIRLKPYQPDAYLMRGSLWMRQGRVDDSLDEFNKVLKIAPYEYGALVNRGAVYFQKGRYDLALEDFTRARSVSENAMICKNQAYCFLVLGKLDEALKNFQQAVKLDPSDEQARQKVEEILRSK